MPQEFAERYPALLNELLQLFAHMTALDREVHDLNVQVPSGAMPLPTAEMMVRGVDRFTTAAPSIVASTVLRDYQGKQIWPVERPLASTLAAAAMSFPIPVVPGAGPMWHETQERRAQQGRAEWERTVRYHEAQAKEQVLRRAKGAQALAQNLGDGRHGEHCFLRVMANSFVRSDYGAHFAVLKFD